MITVTVSGQEYTCTTAVKGNNFIVLYDENDMITASFFEIVDFSSFQISGGNWTPYVEEVLTVRGATISDGLITLIGYEGIETGSIIKIRAPAASEEVTQGISIDGATLPIVNAMGDNLMGVKKAWTKDAILALLIDKVEKLAYVMNASEVALQSGKRTVVFTIGTVSGGWTEEDCDYLCDGIDDQEEINSAIQALPADGGEIVMLNGSYNISAKINITKAVKLTGSGSSTILKRMFNHTSNDGMISISNSNVVVENIQIDNNKDNYSSSSNNGIEISSIAKNVCISGCIIKNNTWSAIKVEGSSNLIKNNWIENSNQYGLDIEDSNNNIEGNTIISSTYGIYARTVDYCKFIGNTVRESKYYGIYAQFCDGNVFDHNFFEENDLYDIYLTSSNSNTINGNVCVETGGVAEGIYLVSSNKNTIVGNNCIGKKVGIAIGTGSHNAVCGNVIADSATDGIALTSTQNSVVTGNSVTRGSGTPSDYSSSQYTIRLKGTSNTNALIANNVIMGKKCTIEGGTGHTIYANKYDETNDMTPEQFGADPAGSAAAAQTAAQQALNAHANNKENPHNVTAAQVGADPAGSAQAVQSNLNTHANNKSNPHGVTAAQIGAAPAYTYGTTDLTAGSSSLATGKLYFVYEE